MRLMRMVGLGLGLVCGLGGFLMAGTANAASARPSLQPLDATIHFQPQAAALRARLAPPDVAATTCTDDTILFGQGRATGLRAINLNNATSAQAAGQWFDAPGPITISGATFYAYVPDAAPAVQATVSIFLADANKLPTGAPLATATIMVSNNLGGETLGELQHDVSFASPVAVAAPFVVAVANPSPNSMPLISNDYQASPPDGQGEFLASADLFGTWTSGSDLNVGGTLFDADWLIEPTVSYEFEASFDPSPTCAVAGTDVTFTNNINVFAGSRFYNQAVFIGAEDQSYEWDYGDGSAPENAVSPTHNYATAGPFTVDLTATVYGWTNNCAASVSKTVVSGEPEFTWAENGMQVSFTDTSIEATAWAWDFGDGNTSTLQNPTHVYSTPGLYSACLQTGNSCGGGTICHDVNAVQTWTVTPSATAGGSITPDTPQTVIDGGTTAFTLAAEPNFYLSGVQGSCGGNLVGDVFTTSAVTTDCSVDAQFSAKLASTTVINPSANPGRVGQVVTFDVEVSGSSAPVDGQVTVTASTGENCSDATAPQVNGNVATFSCPISFATLGPRTLDASFSGSVTHLDSDSAPLDFEVMRFADLSVTVDDGLAAIDPGQVLSYLIEVRNAGPDDAPGSELVLGSVPALLDTSWSCMAVGPAACPMASGTGELGGAFDLPAGGGLDFVQNGTAESPLLSSLSVGVEVGASADAPNYVFDPQNGNNQASDVNPTVLVFGDGFEE